MRYMLDTNILIYLLKNKPPFIIEKVNDLPSEAELWMSFFTYAELLKGAERSTKRSKVMQSLDLLTRQIPVVFNVNKKLCESYGVHFNKLKIAGTPIGANDLWIACHALAESMTLVTHNTREFDRVDGLVVEDWVAN